MDRTDVVVLGRRSYASHATVANSQLVQLATIAGSCGNFLTYRGPTPIGLGLTLTGVFSIDVERSKGEVERHPCC